MLFPVTFLNRISYGSSNSMFWYAILSKYEILDEDEFVLEWQPLLPPRQLVILPLGRELTLLDCFSIGI
jgi:hypothetical protein